jgi:hypothetical protein
MVLWLMLLIRLIISPPVAGDDEPFLLLLDRRKTLGSLAFSAIRIATGKD